MEIVLAAAAACVYGFGDFCGGRASREADSFTVTFIGQIFSVLILGVALIVLADPVAPSRDWMWGAAGGIGGFVGLSMFYFALAKGSMTVVAPTTAVVSAVVPAAAGIGFGERPSMVAYVGVLVAIIGIALVTGAVGAAHAPTPRRIMMIAVLGGCGFGWMFVCLDRTSEDSGMWPLLAARIASISIAAVVIGARRTGLVRRVPALALWAGLFDMGANVLFLLANREGLLTLVSVITALYPVSTIVLAMRLDHERATRSQAVGMVCAGLALTLVAVGR
ncbi:MAG: EamA family transporter [Ilumatobacteraceae bacterium]